MYSLRKSRKILEWSYGWYKKKGDTLNDEDLLAFEADMENLDHAYLRKDQVEADRLARKVEKFTNSHFKKSVWQYITEVIFALIVALAIATVIRQSWFELYEIPTGSMRPTFKEQDHLTVSKTQFGINIPLKTNHFIFDPQDVKRNGIVIWSGDGVALDDTDTTYFGIIPYKKRYVKRLMGKPGDTVYFYGGKIYAIDEKGNWLEELVNTPQLEKIEHIPFLSFEGFPTSPKKGVVQIEQMHQPIGRLSLNRRGELVGEIYNGTEWVTDRPAASKAPHDQLKTYSDFWGIGNYAMARLLTPEQVKLYSDLDTKNSEEGVLYLELIHHPSLTYPKPYLSRQIPTVQMMLNPHHTLIPVQEKHLKRIMDNMYTARFEVKNGLARRYGITETPYSALNPQFPKVADGTYEFYYGKAYKVGFGGMTTELPADHPIYDASPGNVQNLYNFGIEFNKSYEPIAQNNLFFPHRYAYFRDGDLYILGAPIYPKEDPVLKSFVAKEEDKQNNSSENRPYIAFKDQGAPLKNGKIDAEFIRTFGLPLATKQYLVLGDNHAMSSDSRVFGFLPEENLQGVPSLLLWPKPGIPNQPSYPLFTLPRLIVWAIAATIALLWYFWRRYKLSRPLFKKM